MKALFTLLFACMISLSLMGQQEIIELNKERYTKKRNHNVTALEKKKAKDRGYASRDLTRRASSFRSATLKAATATNQKMDSLLWELYDAAHSEWLLNDRELFTYDGNGNMTSYVWFAYDSEDMEILPYDKEIVKHNAQGKPTEIIWQIWDKASGQWLNWGKYELDYDENGNLIQETIADWDPDGNQWMVGAQFDMTFDGSGMLLSELGSFWDEDSSKLVLSYKDEYLYEDGNLTTLDEHFWEEGEWVLIFRTTSTYDSKGNLTEEITLVKDTESGFWFDYSQNLYTYNEADLLIMEEAWELDFTQFMLLQTWQYEYTWDSDRNMIEQVDRSWEAEVLKGANVWEDAFKSEFTFNKNYTILEIYGPYWYQEVIDNSTFVHMPVTELGYFYLDDAWVMDYRQTAYYSDFASSTDIQDFQEFRLSVYPVPASETIAFSWEDTYTHLSLELYNLAGKRVIFRSIDNNETIGIDGLSGGLYLYKLTHNNTLIHSGKISIK